MAGAERTEDCSVCGAKLDYRAAAAQSVCAFCGAREASHIACPKGHFICNACHGRATQPLIEEFCRTTKLQDPREISELLMAHPGLPMLGCEHAFIAAGALMASLRNSPYGKGAGSGLSEVFLRIAKQAHGGYCGLTGVCGIVPAVGAVFSIFLDARCGTDREQQIVMEAVSRVSLALTELTGPSCCKAYVRAAIPVAAGLFQERLGISLPAASSAPVCSHAVKHPHGCREQKCPYYRRPASRDVFADSIHLPIASCGPS